MGYQYVDERNDTEAGATDIWLNNTLRAWLSSPRELKRVLRLCCDTADLPPNSQNEGNLTLPINLIEPESAELEEIVAAVRCRVKFTLPQVKRQQAIKPILALLDSIEDAKFTELIKILDKHRAENERVIIFVERHATAYYLEEKIRTHLNRVGCTITYTGAPSEHIEMYKLKTERQRQRLIWNFAPNANTPKGKKPPLQKDQLDILICTDADGIGQNMQDASVVINYDLPLTADKLFQRAGRVLRPTSERDRKVNIYTLVPDINASRNHAIEVVNDIIKHLSERQKNSNNIIDGGTILPEKGGPNPVVVPLACANDIDNIPVHYQFLEDGLQQGANSALRHIFNYENNIAQAEKIEQTNIMSAKCAKVQHEEVCVLIRGRRGFEHILFDLKTEQIRPSTVEEILDLLECTPDEKKDTVRTKKVEQAAIKAYHVWLEKQSDEDKLFPNERVCVVYLRPNVPQEPEKALGKMLNEN